MPDFKGNRPAVSSSMVLPRVILSIRHFYPDGGGAEVLARRLAVRLVQRGLPLTVLTGRYGRRPRVERIDGVLVRRHFIGLYVPVFHELCYLASFAWELVARRHEYDIVHVFQTQLSAYVASVICKRLGKKTVVTSHGAGRTGDMAVWSSIPGGRRLLRVVASHVDAATGVSRDVVAELHEAGFDRDRTWYLPNGVPVPTRCESNRSRLRAELGLSPNDFIATFIGRLSYEKAPQLLLSAWPRVVSRYPSSKLVFVGEGARRGTLEAEAKENGVSSSVLFTGRVNNVPDYLNAADTFVLPSLTEGMSVALLEAMAARLPVVASRVSGTIDIIRDGENGLLFESGDKEGLIRCLWALMASRALGEGLGEKARETVERRFSLDRMLDRYVALYCSVFHGTAKPSNGFDVEMFQSKTS